MLMEEARETVKALQVFLFTSKNWCWVRKLPSGPLQQFILCKVMHLDRGYRSWILNPNI